MLCHDLLLIEAWREEVFSRPVARVAEKAGRLEGLLRVVPRGHCAQHAGPFLNHKHACKVLGGAPLLELIDLCHLDGCLSAQGRNLPAPRAARGLHLPLGAHQLLSCFCRLALSPHYALLRGDCPHFINGDLASVQRCVAAARGAESFPGGRSSDALDVTTAELTLGAPTAAADGRKVLSDDRGAPNIV